MESLEDLLRETSLAMMSTGQKFTDLINDEVEESNKQSVYKLYTKFSRSDLDLDYAGRRRCSLCNTRVMNDSNQLLQCSLCNTEVMNDSNQLLQHWDSKKHQCKLKSAIANYNCLQQLRQRRQEIDVKNKIERAVRDKLFICFSNDIQRLAVEMEKISAQLYLPSWRHHLDSLSHGAILMNRSLAEYHVVLKKYLRREHAALLELRLVKFVACRRGPFRFESLDELREYCMLDADFCFAEYLRHLRVTEVHRVLQAVVPFLD